LISRKELDNANRWFEEYGGWLIFIGHCLPFIRTYVSFPAGIARMPKMKFFLTTVAGSLLWTVLLSLLGYLMGEHVQQINAIFHRFSYLFVALVVIGIGYYVWHHLKSRKEEKSKQ